MTQQVIFHFVALSEGVISKVATDIQVSVLQLWHINPKVGEEIFTLCFVKFILGVPNPKFAVLVFVENVVYTLLVSKQSGVVMRCNILHLVHIHSGDVFIKYLKSSELVASIENQIAIMGVKQFVMLDVCRFDVNRSVIPSVVLSDNNFKFFMRIADVVVQKINREIYLMMTFVCVNICVAQYFRTYDNTWFQDTKIALRCKFLLIFIKYLYTIIAWTKKLYILVWNIDLIMIIVNFCVERLFIPLNEVIIKTVHILRLKQIGDFPISIAMLQCV